jgi:hypothetical protein
VCMWDHRGDTITIDRLTATAAHDDRLIRY